ncbi:MAG: membrane-associated protein [Parcubacteria group bacterium Gr01-1014_17]|nr:MAG: membrane-associated protein [Parcubacteria group bacterium Gr01-1014_17]
MKEIIEFFNPTYLVTAVGLLGVLAIVFAESGLFFGFFLPGDSLLFTAGLLASLGQFNVILLWLGCTLAAILGDSVGYAFGARVGPKIFTREDSLFFHKKHIERTQAFYARYGKKTVVLARFVPIVRTFAPILAGVGKMEYRVFLVYNILGGFLWTTLLIFLGFTLGSMIPNPDRYLLPIVFAIIVISFLPLIREWWKSKKSPVLY